MTPHAQVLEALDIPLDADDAAVARRLRRLLGAVPDESPDPPLWRRFVEMIAGTLDFPGGDDGDGAQLANSVVSCSIVAPGEPEEQRWGVEVWDRELGVTHAASDDILRRWGVEVWDRELGVTHAASDDILREFVGDEIAPRLARAGLYRLH